jgi:hypothetical protein
MKLRKQLAQKLELHYGPVQQSKPFAVSNCGGHVYTTEQYVAATQKHATAMAIENEAERCAAVKASNTFSFTVSGLQVQWRPLIAVNTGYVLKWMEQNVGNWDSAIERKGAAVNPDDDPAFIEFATTGTSSLLALIVGPVTAYKQTGQIPSDLASTFKSIRLFNTSPEEMGVVNQAENIEQGDRKRHSELDNLLAVQSWVEAAHRVSATGLGNNALDVFKFAVILGDPRRPADTPAWLSKELKNLGKAASLANKLAVVCMKHVNKKYLAEHKANPIHPQMNSFAAFFLRYRTVRGFHALEELHRELYSRAGREGYASRTTAPLSKAVLLDPAILTSDAFSSAADKEAVPGWRDGAAGRSLHQAPAFESGMMAEKAGGGWRG